jgi:hypothetical protein
MGVVLFFYLIQNSEDGRNPGFNFFEIFLKLFKPSGKKADIQIKIYNIFTSVCR